MPSFLLNVHDVQPDWLDVVARCTMMNQKTRNGMELERDPILLSELHGPDYEKEENSPHAVAT
jgi:hypothetical protein